MGVWQRCSDCRRGFASIKKLDTHRADAHTTGYIAWNDGLLGALLHGLMANIPGWSFTRRWVHGHQCSGCQHRAACTCRPERQRELLRCPWCTPWVMEWAPVRVKSKKKRARRRTTRRTLQPVP